MNPEFSIVIATRNRARAVARCLAAIARLDPGVSFETIVVDNGSSDDTKTAVEGASNAALDLQYLFEPEPGASKARNRGIRAARGRFVVFLDDDAEPTRAWLTALAAGFAGTGAAVVGGPILARFEVEPPPWLGGLLRVLSAQDYGASRRPISSSPFLFGGNLAVRREDLEALDGFDESLGPRDKSFFLGEDTDVCERLCDVGKLLLYEPEAIVYHWISSERFEPAYLRNRAFGTGRSIAWKLRRRVSTATLAATLLEKALKLPLHFAAWLWARLLGERETAVLRERSMLVTLGMLREILSRGSGHVAIGAPVRTQNP